MTIALRGRDASGAAFTLTRKEAEEDVHIIARLGKSGSVLAGVHTNGFTLRSCAEGFLAVVKIYDDGDQLVMDRMVVWNLPADAVVNLKIFVGGVTFEDGTVEKNLTAADFSATGEYVYFLVRPKACTTSVCHTTKVYQAGVLVGQR